MSKCDFNKVAKQLHTVNALRHERSPANLLHIFRIPYFLRKTPRGCVWRLKKITQEIPEKFRKL